MLRANSKVDILQELFYFQIVQAIALKIDNLLESFGVIIALIFTFPEFFRVLQSVMQN